MLKLADAKGDRTTGGLGALLGALGATGGGGGAAGLLPLLLVIGGAVGGGGTWSLLGTGGEFLLGGMGMLLFAFVPCCEDLLVGTKGEDDAIFCDDPPSSLSHSRVGVSHWLTMGRRELTCALLELGYSAGKEPA